MKIETGTRAWFDTQHSCSSFLLPHLPINMVVFDAAILTANEIK